MPFTYPQSDLSRPAKLASLLGSFWSGTYAGADDVVKFARTRAQLEQQTQQNLQETIDATSRLSVPVYHTDLWYQLIISEQAMNAVNFSVPKYGEGFVYGPQPDDGSTLLYGAPVHRNVYAFELPSQLAVIPAVYNRTDRPTISWLAGLDYVLDDGYLKLRENPFDNDQLAIRDVFVDGVVVDREASLWLFRSQWDDAYIWTHFGHILRLWLSSSERYRDFLNAIWDALSTGSSLQTLVSALLAVSDTPTVLEDSETVEHVLQDSEHMLVITDRSAYRCGYTAHTDFAVGDVVSKGQPVTNAVRFYLPSHGSKPDWLLAYGLDETLTHKKYRGGLLFTDDAVPLEVDTSGDRTAVRFAIYGWNSTVDKFWQDVRDNESTADKTLANLLDNRPEAEQVGEPRADALPGLVSPLQFLLDNVLRNNSVIVLLRPSEFGDGKLPLWTLGFLRRIMSPHSTLLIIVQLSAVEPEPLALSDAAISPLQMLPTLTEDSFLVSAYGDDSLTAAGYMDEICR